MACGQENGQEVPVAGFSALGARLYNLQAHGRIPGLSYCGVEGRDAFDTKKAAGEKASMDAFIAANEGRIPYEVHSHFCCFNQDSREAIHEGFKKKIALEETMTGREFCDLLEIDYDEIVRVRKEHASENFRTFFEELLGIPEAAKMIEELQNEKR